jgi:hypothetical protein
MDKKSIVKMLELVKALVDADGPWVDKKAAVLAECDDDDKTALQEFVGWFDDGDDG